MNWKEEAIDKLRRYPVMVSAVQTIPRELERLEMEARALQSGAAGKGPGRNLRAQENRLMDNLVRRQELLRLQDNAESWVAVTGQGLSGLNEQEQKLLRLLYVEGANVQQVCMAMGVERSSLYRQRDAALKKLTLAMYGALES